MGEGSPRQMALQNGEIDFGACNPAKCDDCGKKIRKEVVEVRRFSDSRGSRTVFDTAILCGCRVWGGKTMANYESKGYAPDAWVDDEKW